MFLDEPTAGLDPIGATRFDNLVTYLRSSLNLTIIMVTHDMDSLFGLCDRVAVLVDKKVAVGTLDEIVRSPHPWIQSYFNDPRAVRARRKEKKNVLRVYLDVGGNLHSALNSELLENPLTERY